MNDVAPPALTPLEHSLQRMARSRYGLRSALLPDERLEARSRVRGAFPRRLRAWLRSGPLASFTRGLEPWVDDVQRSLQRWWRRHPWRPSVELVIDEAERSVLPWVRRYPLGTVAVGAAAGVALIAAAPWRSNSVRRAVGKSSRHARRWALHQLASPAAQTVLAGLVTSWLATPTGARQQQHSSASAPSPVETPPAEPAVSEQATL